VTLNLPAALKKEAPHQQIERRSIIYDSDNYSTQKYIINIHYVRAWFALQKPRAGNTKFIKKEAS